MALRRANGFARYAFSCQYHGASFLGVSYQGNQEDRILADGADLRGYRSVEGRIREALEDLVGASHYENIQVSSRTDRGVHALKNTFHVDILGNNSDDDMVQRLHGGLNHYLGRQIHSWHREQQQQQTKARKRRRKPPPTNDELRILSVKQPPDYMYNPFSEQDPSQPTTVDWNARFSATERTYIYRVLCYLDEDENWGIPFESDRSWRIRCKSLDIDAMQEGGVYLEGTHDFTTFRGAKCRRSSPIVSMKSIQVQSQPYGSPLLWGGGAGATPGLLGMHGEYNTDGFPQLVTIQIVGNSFLYRQVRNMVGCLVQVGLGKLAPADVEGLLEMKSRKSAPSTAPAHGLFLANVKHGNFHI
jgi:tRNA pseudouridine38-40 synthase